MSLTLDVFNSGYVPVNGGPGWESARAATWPASTATLIAGEREAILVDALMTIEEGRQLASWIGDSGKNLTNIVITHGHGDHFFGAGPVLAAFPEARLVALNTAVVDEARMHVVDPILQNWIEANRHADSGERPGPAASHRIGDTSSDRARFFRRVRFDPAEESFQILDGDAASASGTGDSGEI